MKYLIVANGPFLSPVLIHQAAKKARIIALDGAANKLTKLNIQPDIILGDFDSFQEEESLTSIPKIKLLDQNFTDFQKALQFIKKEATHIDVVCATGGRMDHEQANIRALVEEYSHECSIYLHNEEQTLEYVRDKTVHIRGNCDDFCGFFGMPEAWMIVKNNGLAYGSEIPYHLTLAQFSSSNQLVSDNGAIVEFKGDALVAHPSWLKYSMLLEKESLE